MKEIDEVMREKGYLSNLEPAPVTQSTGLRVGLRDPQRHLLVALTSATARWE